ncbi:hypothetical protein SCAR479_13053 [Seiridium cardinale]|uniref:Uncharacterized protein n=1 Tax=Seiridium cardinale TaxID=138064 RepID=A0ABR2X984_9PEZI
MHGTGDAYAASEAKYYCKVWSHWDIARQFPQKDQPSNSEIDQAHLDLLISRDDIYNRTYDSQLVKVVTVLGDRRNFPNEVEVSARIGQKTFLRRTILELELDVRLVVPAHIRRSSCYSSSG